MKYLVLFPLFFFNSSMLLGSDCEYVFALDDQSIRKIEEIMEESENLEQKQEPRKFRYPQTSKKSGKRVNGIHQRRIRRFD